jgi:hypothetical protein
MKFIFCSITFLYLSFLHPSKLEVAQNFSPSQKAKEYGKVDIKDGLAIPKTYYLGSKDSNFFFSLAYTLWVPYQGGMNIVNSNLPPFEITHIVFVNKFAPKTFPKSGFKIEAEKYLHFDDWKANIQYTWFNSQNPPNNRNFNIEYIYFSPWFPKNFEISDFYDVSSYFNNQFNRIDGVIYRDLWLKQSFIFSNSIGLIGAWEEQNFYILAERALFRTNTVDFIALDAKQYWWCVGPYANFETTYRVLNHFSLFFKGGASVNLAKHDVYEVEYISELNAPHIRSNFYNMEDHRWDTEPMVEGSIGFKLNYSKKNVAYLLSVAWEAQTWFSHNGFIQPYTGLISNNPYSMQGLTVNVGIVF